ncbi:hypothetical protein MANY_13960 [Mycolicibacterium anyangense]|jgi:hypothetical protein|uniref:Uncharacterized protein n=1 Tax=Mycolicibacterium anyangense TaxID=1431246 RepID=A0A6N4W4X3_9MYCO|nr:hypothetical protein MANY_13960 [Mycolicibacterium anyangense]
MIRLMRNGFGCHLIARRSRVGPPTFRLTDRLHEGRTVTVTINEIAATVSDWLAELGVHSPMVDQLASALRGGNWTAVQTIADHLAVEITAAP